MPLTRAPLTLIRKPLTVIPEKAGIQSFRAFLDPGACPGPRSGVRWGDGVRNSLFLELTALGPTPSPARLSAGHPVSQALGRTHQVAPRHGRGCHFVARHAFAFPYANTAAMKSFHATVRSAAACFRFEATASRPFLRSRTIATCVTVSSGSGTGEVGNFLAVDRRKVGCALRLRAEVRLAETVS